MEVACGSAALSLCAARPAARVFCIALDGFRLRPEIADTPNIRFEKMDARRMRFPSAQFTTIFLYNAVFHLKNVLPEVLTECLRVLKPGGCIIAASTFLIDKPILQNEFAAFLESKGIAYAEQGIGKHLCIHFSAAQDYKKRLYGIPYNRFSACI